MFLMKSKESTIENYEEEEKVTTIAVEKVSHWRVNGVNLIKMNYE